MLLGRFLLDVSPKRRALHINQPPVLPIAQPCSHNPSDHNPSDHNNAESCAHHDLCRNPSASRVGHPFDRLNHYRSLIFRQLGHSADHIKTRFFRRFMPPPRLIDRNKDAPEIIAQPIGQAPGSSPKARRFRMLYNPTEPTRHRHRPKRQLFFATTSVSKVRQLAPRPARRMKHTRNATAPGQRIALNVETIDASHALVMGSLANEQGRALHTSPASRSNCSAVSHTTA